MSNNVKKCVFFVFVSLGVCLNSGFSQGVGSVQGVVKDTDEELVPLVELTLNKGTHQTVTDENGYFLLTNIPEGEYTLHARCIGYEQLEKVITVRTGEQTVVTINLVSHYYDMPQVNIFSNKKDRAFESIPGSLTYIDKKEIELVNSVNTNEVLRRSPGVHVVEEEGAGLRMNLAVRGLDAARSRSTLILEDGIPLALAPYGEPEMYYSPAMEKMEGVEILKGSGSILYGPQTIGGVVNFITKDPPKKQEGKVALKGGEYGFFSGLISYGNTVGNSGIQITYLRKQVDNLGPTMFELNDLSSKFKYRFNENSYLGIKVGVYDEYSNSTYLGMTQQMYDSGDYDYQTIAPKDRLRIRRYNVSASHKYKMKKAKLTTTAFAYTTTRNWMRQDFVNNSFDSLGILNPKPQSYSGVTLGDETVEGGAIYLLNSTGNRNRTYEIIGAESRIDKKFKLGNLANELIGGVRILQEVAYEQRINGSKPDALSGTIMNDEVRTGVGTSAYLHHKINLTSRLSLTSGVRMEMFNDTRDIRRSRFTINDVSGVLRDTSIIASNFMSQIIPGAGFNWSISENASVFGGAHKGFSPPRTKDAISTAGVVHELDAEQSWNYELGLRGGKGKIFNYEITGFYMDFSNQVIPVAEHAGGIGAGVTNGGATVHRGVETAVYLDFGKWFDWKRLTIIYDANIAFIDARFNSERYMNNGSEDINVNGNKTPYAPELLVSSALTFKVKENFSSRINLTYVSDQFTDPFNTIEAQNNGREGKIDAYYLIDFSMFYNLKRWNTTFNVGVKNLLNNRYIASKRPQGIMMGMPRFVSGGFTYTF